MPYEIDTDKLNDPSLQILDIGKPPVRQMQYQAYPKMVYLHPKDKTKQHRTKVVEDEAELDTAERQGWKAKPHIPVEPVEDLSLEFEAEPLSRDPLDTMTKDQLLEESKRRNIAVDGRSSIPTILAALRAEPISA